MTSKISSCLLWWISNHFQNQLTGQAMCCRPTPAATDTTPGTTTGTTPVAHKQGVGQKGAKFEILMGFCMYFACMILVECRFLKGNLGRLSSCMVQELCFRNCEKIQGCNTYTCCFESYGSFVGWHLDKWFCGSFGKGKVTSSSLSRGNSECHM